MADTMQFDLVSPERRLASVQAKAVQIPGAEGDLTAMPNHAPTITTLRPGLLVVETADGEQEFVVSGGFAEINAEATTVLAESALPRADVTSEYLNDLIEKAEMAHASAAPDAVAEAVKLVADLVAVGGRMGLSTKDPAL